MALLVSLSAVVFLLLFLVSWGIYTPVMALLVAPFTLLAHTLLGLAPSALLNSLAAAALGAALAGATVTLVFRVLLRRARARHLRAELGA